MLFPGDPERTRVDADDLTTPMPRCRPFKLIDAMILIGASAVWMALMRTRWAQLQRVGNSLPKGLPWQALVGIVQNGLNISLWMLTLAYLVIRLIPPRPPGPDLIRQPGMLFLGSMIALLILSMLLSAFVPLVPWTNIPIALALVLSWLVASRRHRSRAEPGWIEVLGRTVGVGWIVSEASSYPLYLMVYR